MTCGRTTFRLARALRMIAFADQHEVLARINPDIDGVTVYIDWTRRDGNSGTETHYAGTWSKLYTLLGY